MPWIAIDLDRAALDRFYDDAAAISAKRQRAGETQWDAGCQAFGNLNVGHHLFRRPAT